MTPVRWQDAGKVVLALAGLVAVLAVHAALPGITLPTLGQAVWTAGFAQSFANDGFFAIYARNFGAPEPAAISFGLSGALPCAWLISLGMAPFVAYTTMVASWLTVAYAGAIALGRRFGNGLAAAGMLATLWLCLPMAWMHAAYSMLGLGIALLPAYLWTTIRYLDAPSLRRAALLAATAVVSAFMDGYTFVMFAAGTGVLGAGAILSARVAERRWRAAKDMLSPVESFSLAVVLYKAYVHGGDYGAAPLSMFRAWGLDVAFAWLPTTGEFWFWDAVHLGSARDGQLLYGDASVWLTTFAAPLLVVAPFAAWCARRHAWTRWIVAVAVMGMYLSLGPSLKVDSHKPAGVADAAMPATAAVMSTRTGLMWKHVPGIRLMRAPYRWAALGYCACWMLLVLASGQRGSRIRQGGNMVVLAVIIVMLLPHPGRKIMEGLLFRDMARAIDDDWIAPLRDMRLGPRVAFVPYGNDFLATYTAARLGVRTYNVGGDKNLEQASVDWPALMTNLGDPAQPAVAGAIPAFLMGGAGDQVVVPYVDMLGAAHVWPCPLVYDVPSGAARVSSACIAQTRQQYEATLQALASSPYVDIATKPLFAVISLKPRYVAVARHNANAVVTVTYPIRIAADAATARLILRSGWNPEEPGIRWSQARGRLTLPGTAACAEAPCRATFRIAAFAASPARPVRVVARLEDGTGERANVTLQDGGEHDLVLVVPAGSGARQVELDVPDAASPAALEISTDGRVLGVNLISIDLAP